MVHPTTEHLDEQRGAAYRLTTTMFAAAFLPTVACVNPASFGAVPDDHRSDRAAFQQAIDLALTTTHLLCIGPGVWDLDRSAGIGSLQIFHGGPLAIYGAGPSTILRMTGDGRHGTWVAIQMKDAHDISLSNLTIDGLGAFDTEEQTHLVDVNYGSKNIKISSLVLGPMRRVDQHPGAGIGGDCVRLLGKRGEEVEGVSIENTMFTNCDRSGVHLERALSNIRISGCRFEGTGDTDIDFEPTGRGVIDGVVIDNVTILRSPEAQGGQAISVGGTGRDDAMHIKISHATIVGGGVGMLNVQEVELVDDKITYGARGLPVITIQRRAKAIRIAHSTIARPASARPAPLISLQADGRESQSTVTIESNELRQETAAPAVVVSSASMLSITHNKIAYAGSKRDVPIIRATAAVGDVDHVTIEDNEITGEAGSVLLTASQADHTVSDVRLIGNHAFAGVRSLVCRGAPARFRRVSVDSTGPICSGVKIERLATIPASRKK